MARDIDSFGKDGLGTARVALLVAGVDHLEVLQSNCTQAFPALPRLIMGHELPWPFLATARICLESATRVAYVIDPAISPVQRLMRMAALMVWSNGEELTMANIAKNSDGPALAEMKARINDSSKRIKGLISDSGLEMDESRIIDPSGNYKPISIKLNAVDLIRAEFPELGEESYRRMSGFVHGAPWALGKATYLFAKSLGSPTIDGTSVLWGFHMAGASISKMMVRSASYAGIPLGRLPERLSHLEELCRDELDRMKQGGAARRFIGPGRGWNARYSTLIIRAWGHEPAAKGTGDN
ncbi:hypothetical protein [Arthrobacter alkaliphilus]|uniref:hypothetical protein n=1 Tax=Arthrobacter alkaliphilus TaxID=369936 RepID=UPI001F41F477|nr:hypothetical protein [Arthrobacter alkaliphilus]